MVTAVWFESTRLGLSVVDIDATILRQCTHLNSQAHGDILVRSSDLEIEDCDPTQFVSDVKTVVEMVDSNGDWGGAMDGMHEINSMKILECWALLAAEQIKYRNMSLHSGTQATASW